MFVPDVMFDDESEFQSLVQSEHKRQTEEYFSMFVSDAMFDDHSEW